MQLIEEADATKHENEKSSQTRTKVLNTSYSTLNTKVLHEKNLPNLKAKVPIPFPQP